MKRDLVIVLGGRVLQVITSLFVVRVMTHLLNQEQMGKVVIIMSITTFFALLFINPVGTYINRRLHDWQQSGLLKQRIQFYIVYIFLVTLLANVVLVVFYFLYADRLNTTLVWLALLVSGSLIINTLNQTIIPTLNMLGRRVASVLFGLVTLWFGLAASAFLVASFGKAEYWLAGQLVGLLVGTACASLSFRQVVHGQRVSHSFRVSRDQLKRLWMFSLPVSLAVGMTWVQFQSYRFIVTDMVGLEYLGLFAAGYNLSTGIMGAFETTAMQFYYPIIYKEISSEATDEQKLTAWNRYASVMLPLTCLTVLLISLLSVPLSHFLLDEAYWDASKFVVWGAVAELGRVLGGIYGFLAHAKMKTSTLIVPQAIGAGLTVLLVPSFIPLLPVHGVGAALATASLVYVLCMHMTMKRVLPFRLDYMQFLPVLLFPIPILLFGWGTVWLRDLWVKDLIHIALSGLAYLGGSYYIIRRTLRNDRQGVAATES